jgi:hypothetical protein
LDIAQGDHACLVYEKDPAEQAEVIIPFLAQGLEAGERCVFVAGQDSLDWARRSLEYLGVDVSEEVLRGSLLLWSPDQWRKRGTIPALKRVTRIWTYIQDGLNAGFNGVRFVVDKSWYRDADIDISRTREWEATIDAVFTPDVPARLICLYDQGLLPEIIENALCTHPTVVIENQICPNPYYDAPLMLQSDSADYLPSAPTTRKDWMLSRLQLVYDFRASYIQPRPIFGDIVRPNTSSSVFVARLEEARRLI